MFHIFVISIFSTTDGLGNIYMYYRVPLPHLIYYKYQLILYLKMSGPLIQYFIHSVSHTDTGE